MAIKIEKILTISATEWFAMNNKKPFEYEARGVHKSDDRVSGFAECVPTDAEVVVRFSILRSKIYNEMIYYGTALIPRKK